MIGRTEPNVADPTRLMAGLSLLQVRFWVESIDATVFGTQPGSALRGALYATLARRFCSRALDSAQDAGDGGYLAAHLAQCPVCRLLAPQSQGAARGQDIVRPLTIQPPLGQTTFAPGAQWCFTVTLAGRAQELLMFVLRAVADMGQHGVGRGRSRFKLLAVEEYSPVLDAARPLLRGNIVRRPRLIVNVNDVSTAAARLPDTALHLELLTPMRLTAQGRLVKHFDLPVFVQRLVERVQAMSVYYGSAPASPAAWRAASDVLTQAGSSIEVCDETEWVEAASGSRRLGRTTPISGIMGRVRLRGDLSALRPWLIWGQCLHVGKDAVKGNGWYCILDL